jgi:nucleotide-binding universal stress UspA family protein
VSIVVGYIPTREGRAALRRAAAEAELRKAELLVVNSDSGKSFDPDETLRFETALESLRGRLVQAGVNVEVRQLVGGKEPAEDLIEAAESTHAELIVIGLRRRTPVGKLILGSNAQRILLDATCPVLAVKATSQDD